MECQYQSFGRSCSLGFCGGSGRMITELIIFFIGSVLGCATGVAIMCICIWSGELSKGEHKE